MKENSKLTNEEINKIKELSYINWEEGNIGFMFKETWITNPFLEESGRFEFKSLEEMYKHYGEKNVNTFIDELLNKEV